MGFLIFLIIFIIVIKLTWPWISRKLQEKAAQMMAEKMRRDFEEQARRGGGFGPFSAWFGSMDEQAPDPDTPSPAQPRRTKVFSATEGEYAEYEDLEGRFHTSYTETTTTVVEESQVSDAEWEEIR